jgi:hypothetical protein
MESDLTNRRERQRRYRERRRAGLPTVGDALVITGRLPGWDAEDRAASNKAMAKLLLDWTEAVERLGRDPLDPQTTEKET